MIIGTNARARASRVGRAARAGIAIVAVVAMAASCARDTTTAPVSASTTSVAPGAVNRPVTGAADEAGPPQRGGALVFGVEAEPDGLDPSRSALDTSGHLIASAVFDPLVTLDGMGKAVPHLAKSIDPSEDFKEWTIKLRPDVTFHDGAKVDADAVQVNLDYYTKSFITAPSLVSIDHFEVIDPLTVRVTMKQAWTSFPYTLTTQTGYIAAPDFLQNPDQSGPSMHPVGSGPFKFKAYTKGESFEVQRNETYWQKDLPNLDQVKFRFMSDELSRLNALTNRDIDMLHALQPTVVSKVRESAAKGELKVVENGEGEEDNIAINTEKEPFDDILARRAIAYATDAEKWREHAEVDAKREVHGPFAKGQIGYTPDDAYHAFDLEKAKQNAAEYEKKHGHAIEAEVLTTGSVDDQAQMQLLIDQWAKAGIKVTIKKADLAALIIGVVTGGFQLAGWRNFGSLDPDGDYLWWHSSGVQPSPKISTNVARIQDPETDKALDDARGTTDDAKRDKDYQIVMRRMNELVGYIWLGRPTWVVAANTDVQGLSVIANGSGATLGNKTWIATLWIKH